MKKIDIVIIVYNDEKNIKKCLESAINQSVSNYNIIIIDDGSTDNTKKIITEYLDKYKFIHYFYKDHTGISDSRNYAISKIMSDYFLFLDSDDCISSNLIKEITTNISISPDILCYDIVTLDLQRHIKPKFANLDGYSAFIKLMSNDLYVYQYSIAGYCFNTSFFKDQNILFDTGSIYEGINVIPLLLLKSSTVISIDNAEYYYFTSPNSLLRDETNTDRLILDRIKHISMLYTSLIEYGLNYSEHYVVFWKLFDYAIEITAKIPKNKIKLVTKALKKYDIYRTIPICSKLSKLYRLLFKCFPFIFIYTHLILSYNYGYYYKDYEWYSFLTLVHFDSYEKYNKMLNNTSNYYLRKLKRLGILLTSTLKYIKFLSKNTLYLDYIEIPITMKCSLNCKKCANLIPYYKKMGIDDTIDYSLMSDSINKLLSISTYIKKFRILGGEPFISKDLYNILNVIIGSKKVKEIEIVTNGTIIPKDKKLLELLSNKKILVCISDYKLKNQKIKLLISIFNKYSIKYKIYDYSNPANFWIDFGEPYSNNNKNKSDLEAQFKLCNNKTRCLCLLKGKIHLCPRSANGMDLGLIKDNPNEYIDLFNKNQIIKKKNLVENFKNLICKTNYISACKYCYIGTDKAIKIKAAEQ